MDLLDRAGDHRRGALDGPAHQVPWAVAVMDLGEPPLDRHGRAVRAGGHVAARQHAGQDVRAGSNSELRTSAGPRSPASMMAQEWWATSRHSMASACWASRRYRAPSSWCSPVRVRPGRSRCRAATRRLPAHRRQRRERVPGRVPGRRRPGSAPSGGEEVPAGVPGLASAVSTKVCPVENLSWPSVAGGVRREWVEWPVSLPIGLGTFRRGVKPGLPFRPWR